MSETKSGPVISDTMHEVQGIFPSDAALQDAISRLSAVGFDRADLSLPVAQPAPGIATPEQGAENPTTDIDNRQMRTMQTSMAASAGAIAAAGITVATGGAAALVIGAAVVAGAGAGALANAAGTAVSRVQADGRDAAAAMGELVLSVRAPDQARQDQAMAAMRQAGATRVEAVRRVGATIT